MKLHDLIDWSAIESKLVGLYKREKSGAGGPEPYSPLSMFKLVLLGQWHRLSDMQMEQALKVRLDFLVFCGFDLGAELPDHSTICRFRNRMVAARLDDKVLAEINRQLANLVERCMRPVAVGRKAWLFAGAHRGGEAAATALSLIETCKLNGIEPYAYLKDVLMRIGGHRNDRLAELLPFNWKPLPAAASPV